MHQRRPTLVQVSRRAGVSVASVSRALNGGPASAATVRRVNEAVAELGYVPDATARLLKLGHAPAVAFAAADMSNPVYVEMMSAMEHVFRAQGIRLTITSAGADPEGIAELADDLGRGMADGLIISPLRQSPALSDALTRIAVPIVVLGRLDHADRLDQVRVDSAAGIGLAVDHLVDLGHRRIVLVNGPLDTTPGRSRAEGFRAASARHGLLPQEIVEASDFTTESGELAVAQFLRNLPAPDAVIGANDLLAIGAMRALAAHGLRGGTDVAVAGVDDTRLTDLVYPSLTSVSLRSADRARIAAQLLVERIERPSLAPRRIDVEPTLTVRDSTLLSQSTRRLVP